MKIKKVLGYFILSAFTVSSITLASCGDDDDDDDNNNNVVPEVKDTTNKVPADTTNKVPNVPSDESNDPTDEGKEPETSNQFKLDDVQGIWHAKLATGQEEYVEISNDITHIIRYNTEYMGEDHWLSLKLGGTNVENNKIVFSPSYLTNSYGYVIKIITENGMVVNPKSQYFEDENYNTPDVTFTKVSELPARFLDEYYIFQFSMDYTNW